MLISAVFNLCRSLILPQTNSNVKSFDKKAQQVQGGRVLCKKGQNAAGKEDQRTRDQCRRELGENSLKEQRDRRAEKQKEEGSERNQRYFFHGRLLSGMFSLLYQKRAENTRGVKNSPRIVGACIIVFCTSD